MWLASALGSLFALAVCLALVGLPLLVIGMWLWTSWQRVQRQRRARMWERMQPYDRARIRTAETVAWENGVRDELADIEAMRRLER